MTNQELVSTNARHLRHLLLVAIGQEEIGRRIAQAREDAGLTQQELADRIGVQTAQSVSRYERAETEVSPKRLRRIAEATNKEMSYFVLEPLQRVTGGFSVDGSEPEGWRQVLAAVEDQRAELRQLLLELVERLPPATRDTHPEPPPG